MYTWHCGKKRFKLKTSSTFGGYSVNISASFQKPSWEQRPHHPVLCQPLELPGLCSVSAAGSVPPRGWCHLGFGTWSCCPGWGRAVFMQIHEHPAQLEMRFAVRTVFPSGSLGSVFQPEPRSRSIPAIVFWVSHLHIAFWFGFCYFFFPPFLIIKLWLCSWKL